MGKFTATVMWRGIGNETLYVNAKDRNEAFRKVFEYYLNKGERLGYWLDGDGEQVSDFDDDNGLFEYDTEWDCYIVAENEVKILE